MDLVRRRLQKLVTMSGLSRARFAQEIGFDKNNFNLILNGKRKVPESLIAAIVNGGRITYEELVYGSTDAMVPSYKNFSGVTNSGGGDMTINAGTSEAQSKRADAITNKMLDMLAKGIEAIQSRLESHDKAESTNMTEISQRLEERNRLANRLMGMLEAKDEQLKAKDAQINTLTDLLANKDKSDGT